MKNSGRAAWSLIRPLCFQIGLPEKRKREEENWLYGFQLQFQCSIFVPLEFRKRGKARRPLLRPPPENSFWGSTLKSVSRSSTGKVKSRVSTARSHYRDHHHLCQEVTRKMRHDLEFEKNKKQVGNGGNDDDAKLKTILMAEGRKEKKRRRYSHDYWPRFLAIWRHFSLPCV